jgi:hypothetical protein
MTVAVWLVGLRAYSPSRHFVVYIDIVNEADPHQPILDLLFLS